MVGLELSINGERISTAGIGDVGFIYAQVHWNGGAETLGPDGFMEFRASGVNIPKAERIDWPMPPLVLGDEITIKIVRIQQPDPGESRPMPTSSGDGGAFPPPRD